MNFRITAASRIWIAPSVAPARRSSAAWHCLVSTLGSSRSHAVVVSCSRACRHVVSHSSSQLASRSSVPSSASASLASRSSPGRCAGSASAWPRAGCACPLGPGLLAPSSLLASRSSGPRGSPCSLGVGLLLASLSLEASPPSVRVKRSSASLATPRRSCLGCCRAPPSSSRPCTGCACRATAPSCPCGSSPGGRSWCAGACGVAGRGGRWASRRCGGCC